MEETRLSWKCRRFGLPAVLAVLVCVLDQLTKWLIQKDCPVYWEKPVVDGWFSLVHVRNTGAAWSMFSEHPALLGMVSLACLGGLLFFFHSISGKKPLHAALLGLLMGGAAGNMLDRFFRGSVIDFLDFHWGAHHFPAFNVADMAISVSVILLLALSVFEKKDPEPRSPEECP